MKIGIDCRELSENRLTGIGRYTLNLINILQNLNFEKIYLISDKSIPVTETNKIKHIKFNKKVYLFKKIIYENIFLKNIIKDNKIDIFFSPFYKTVNINNVIKIVTVHDIGFITFPLQYYARSGIYRFFAKNILFNSLKTSDYIIAVSEFTKNEIIETFDISPEKIIVVNNCISENFSSIKLSEKDSKNNDKYILSVSNFKPHKNIKGLLFAYKKYQDRIKLPLIIAGGTGKWFDIVKKTIDDNKIHNVTILQNLKDEKLKEYYTNAELFVYPSLYEGFGLPPVEAASLGSVTVSSDRASLKEVLDDAALYFNPYDIDDIGMKIIKCLQDVELRKKLIINGKKLFSRYSSKKISDKLKYLFETKIMI